MVLTALLIPSMTYSMKQSKRAKRKQEFETSLQKFLQCHTRTGQKGREYDQEKISAEIYRNYKKIKQYMPSSDKEKQSYTPIVYLYLKAIACDNRYDIRTEKFDQYLAQNNPRLKEIVYTLFGFDKTTI